MKIIFDENKLNALGYKWDLKKEYMYKSIIKNKINNKIFYDSLFISKDGIVDLDNGSYNLVVELKENNLCLK